MLAVNVIAIIVVTVRCREKGRCSFRLHCAAMVNVLLITSQGLYFGELAKIFHVYLYMFLRCLR